MLDTETTGLDTQLDQITQFAAILIHEGKIVAEFCVFVRATRPTHPRARAVTGITDQQIRSGKPFTEMIFDWFTWLRYHNGVVSERIRNTRPHKREKKGGERGVDGETKGCVSPWNDIIEQKSEAIDGKKEQTAFDMKSTFLPIRLVAHNGFKFDYPIIIEEMKRCGLATNADDTLSLFSGKGNIVCLVDTLPLSRLRHSAQPRHDLLTLWQRVMKKGDKEKFPLSHNALGDCRALVDIIYRSSNTELPNVLSDGDGKLVVDFVNEYRSTSTRGVPSVNRAGIRSYSSELKSTAPYRGRLPSEITPTAHHSSSSGVIRRRTPDINQIHCEWLAELKMNPQPSVSSVLSNVDI